MSAPDSSASRNTSASRPSEAERRGLTSRRAASYDGRLVSPTEPSIAAAVDALAAALGPGRARELAAPAVREEYSAALARALAAWPGVAVPHGQLAQWVADRLPEGASLLDGLRALRLDDLFIACACATGNPAALVAFETRFFSEVTQAVQRVSRSSVSVDDIKQLVRERLFVSDGTRPPRIAEYRGAGALRSWLRVTSTRIALNAATRGPRETPHDDELFANVATSEESSELSLIKTKYRAEFRAAVQTAVAALDPGDKNLLMHAFAQGLSIDRIGAMYGIHRATAARRLTRARECFVEGTKRALSDRLHGASAGEVDSIIGLIQSRFDLTLGSFLRDGSDSD